jgi:hypothetical protein
MEGRNLGSNFIIKQNFIGYHLPTEENQDLNGGYQEI